LSPEGWLGLVATVELQGWAPKVRAAASLVLVGTAGLAMIRQWRRRRTEVLGALALTVPVLVGWGLLVWEARTRANASYDAYKLLGVFFPGLLAGMCFWLRLAEPGRNGDRKSPDRGALVAALVIVVLAGNLVAAGRFRRAMQNPPLRVDSALAEVGRLEDDARVGSLNMRVADFWSRLWANAFLLKKPQYFLTHTYEGRKNTPLKGEWDLRDDVLRTLPASPDDFVVINARYYALRNAAGEPVGAQWGAGWYAEERQGRERWRWATGEAGIALANPRPQALRARLTLRVRAVSPRDLVLRIEGSYLGARPLAGPLQEVMFEDVVIPPGKSVLKLTSSKPPASPSPGDARLLSVALYGFELRTLAPGKAD